MMMVINLENIKFASLNKKYYGNFGLTKEYREFKKLLTLNCLKVKINPPYRVEIIVRAYQDIDNFIKPVLDSLQESGVIDNDKNVESLIVTKDQSKRGELGWIEVYVDTYESN
jgi:Holliday junction resolvase RusA-like endonuclease